MKNRFSNSRMHHAEIELRRARKLRPDHALVQEGIAEAIAGGPDDGVVAFGLAVVEVHDRPVETRNPVARQHGAVAKCREDRRVQRRMHAGQTARGPLQAVFLPRSEVEAHEGACNGIEHEARHIAQIVAHPGVELIDRTAEHHLGQDQIAMAHADRGRGRNARDIDGDVAGGIAAADDQHALVLERLRPLVFA